MSGDEYNSFNKFYYLTSIVIIIGTFGFNYSYTKVELKQKIQFLLVFVNVLIITAVSYFIGKSFSSDWIFIAVFVTAFGTILFGINSFKYLFIGNYKKYFLFFVVIALFEFLVIAFLEITDLNAILLYTIALFFAFLFLSRLFIKGEESGKENILKFCKIGLTAFVINAAVGLILGVDKYIANNYLSTEAANAYTFSWVVTSPILYIGNLIEKLIYSFSEKYEANRIVKPGILLFAGLIVYGSTIFTITKIFPSILPELLDIPLFYEILLMMLIGYSVFSLINFPLNGFLFKYSSYKYQKMISIGFLVIVALFLISVYFVVELVDIDYLMLYLTVISTILTLLIVKVLILFPEVKKR